MKQIICLMSGGVDSSVCAYLLKQQGYNVRGVFLRLLKTFNSKPAELVAKKLGIKLEILDLQKEFKANVIDYFIKERKAGATPNPCVQCNKSIKFSILDKFRLVATGHYAIINQNKLFRGIDNLKDQSYFLWQLDSTKLSRIKFPLGEYHKRDIKLIAKKLQLPNIRKESMNVCFLQNKIKSFFRKHFDLTPGKIIDTSGKIVGRHNGLALYTIGQRAGISGGLYYVLQINTNRNELIVTKDEDDLFLREFKVRKWHWISDKEQVFKTHKQVYVQIRYGHKAQLAKLYNNTVVFNKEQRAITPGQSAVVYDALNKQVLGGGIIQ